MRRQPRQHCVLPPAGSFFGSIEEFFSEETRARACRRLPTCPVGPLVFRASTRRYRNIRRIAAVIAVDTPDEVVHELRIECKKLRYLLEFFKELIPEEEGAALLKSLRRLQRPTR